MDNQNFVTLWEKHKRNIIFVVVGLVLCIGLYAYGISAKQYSSKDNVFLTANELYKRWTQNQLVNRDAFLELVSQQKTLVPYYSTQIMHQLIESGENKKAIDFCQKNLVLSNDDPYTRFSQGTIQILQHRYKEALAGAYSLQTSLKKENALLNIYNLLRIAVLEKKLGNPSKAKQSFSAVKKTLETTSVEATHPIKNILDKLGTEQSSSLKQFVTMNIES